jgi:hypothetical protein
MKITKWKLVTIMEMDAEGIVSIKHLDPIQLQEEDDDGEDDEGSGDESK